MKSLFKLRIISNKQHIVRLIQQDLKHCQLLYRLNRVGLDEDEKHHLQIFVIVYDLMKVPQSLEFDWGKDISKLYEAGIITRNWKHRYSFETVGRIVLQTFTNVSEL